ncbi:MAG: hypothetical protein CMH85_17480, partial [Novosphingobium sp.]|nr:hypothetical protein [Novosphingobium sp.]
MMNCKTSRAIWRFTISTAIASLTPGVALAQASVPDDQQGAQESGADQVTSEPIVVTGTLIRGIAPAGSNVIGVSSQDIEATGASSTSQVLSTVPQVGNFFNALPAGVSPQAGANASNPINRPNLRNLPGANTSGGAQTLV